MEKQLETYVDVQMEVIKKAHEEYSKELTLIEQQRQQGEKRKNTVIAELNALNGRLIELIAIKTGKYMEVVEAQKKEDPPLIKALKKEQVEEAKCEENPVID